ncbi:MAG TPA: hypothetical protein VGN20_19450 [Mucilaginibacter sp.]|jgi:hypothetical protein
MDQLQLYLNDELVDLSNDSPIALTFQINDLADVKNQQGNTSNQFKLPLTQRNRRILGFPDDIAVTTNLPYQKYQAKLIQDGLEIIPYGIGELNGIDQDTANITILSGNVDFFDAIDGKLYDMGDSTSQWSSYGQNLVWRPYDHTWSLDNAANSQTKTDGWIWPVIDYGLMTDDFTQPINVRNMRPGFFIKTAIDLLLQSAGYKGTGSLLVDPLYPLLIAQFSNGNFEHGTDYQNQPDNWGIAVENLMQTYLNYPNVLNPAGTLNWNSINSDPSQQFSGNTTFTSKQINNVIITVTLPHVLLYGRITPPDFSSTLSVFIRIHRPGLPDITPAQLDFSFNGYGPYPRDPNGWTRVLGTNGNKIIGSMSFYNSVLSFQTTLPAGASVDIYYEFTGFTGSHAYIYPNATFSVKSQNGTVQFGQTLQCERIFPDISQKDLLKDTLQRFGIVCQTDNNNKTISFNSFKDIVNNIPIAKDWTTKCLDQGKQVTFQLGNYAQVNYMQYQEDANILPSKFGWSQINIANQTLAASAQLFVSLFGVTLNRPFYGGTISQITMIDNTSGSDDFSIGVTPRILIDQKLNIGALGKTITFTDGSGNNRYINDIISTPYFYKPDAPEPQTGYGAASLLFDDLRKKYYPDLEKVLMQTKKVVRFISLTPRDILELDLLTPIYIQQDSSYYYINKISAWRKRQPTKVELIKLG